MVVISTTSATSTGMWVGSDTEKPGGGGSAVGQPIDLHFFLPAIFFNNGGTWLQYGNVAIRVTSGTGTWWDTGVC